MLISLTMNIETGNLPESDEVNVAALSRLFEDTTTSYKYLFFTSLLDILRRRQFEVLLSISFEEIIVEMLANAWFPHTYFKLSFGVSDKIAIKLDSLSLSISEPILKFTDTDKKLLRETIGNQDLRGIVSDLKRYVPFRLIIPFLVEELTSVSRAKGNELELAMPTIADQYFQIRKPIYRFDSTRYSDCKALYVHPDWAVYLQKHYVIIRGWSAWEWLKYMQIRNPNVPSIVNKLFMPQQRASLSKQTKYWKQVLAVEPIRCIYSGEILSIDNISLDHYLPWSFVAHDQLWNIVPVRPEVNSSKSNHLPSDQYLRAFIMTQHLGLVTAHKNLGERSWHNTIDSYVADLKINADELLDLEKLSNAYQSTIHPLLTLATNQGFLPNWIFK
jgi:hypothetical protein